MGKANLRTRRNASAKISATRGMGLGISEYHLLRVLRADGAMSEQLSRLSASSHIKIFDKQNSSRRLAMPSSFGDNAMCDEKYR